MSTTNALNGFQTANDLEVTGELDEATQDGVLAVIERMCLRECMIQNKAKYDNPCQELTTQTFRLH